MTAPHTKERILEAAEALMGEKSFHSVGLNEILRAEEVRKGSSYHYFESKEHFGVEMLKHYIKDATHKKSDTLFNRGNEADPMKRLITFLEEATLLGKIPEGIDSAKEAGAVRDLWAGAIQRSTIVKSTVPVENALACIRSRIASHEASCKRTEGITA